MKDEYEVVIGLEIHAELKTKTKVFCSCPNKFGEEPNTNCCPVCIGLPGSLPVLNKRAVELTIKAGLCLGCDINELAIFDRKNYFYPDLSKAYQISQLARPICLGGGLSVNNGEKFIRLNRIHLEEDAGKLVHKNESIGTIIDYNRGGVPLIEMVTEPDISNSDEAIEFLTKLRSNLIFADIADCKMEQGGMRCDVNISVRKKGAKELGTRTEMKNLNSFKSVARAISFEADRQIEVMENGGKIKQETRKWDDEKGKSLAMRSKESSQDYRYFPDPDLLAVRIDRELVSDIKREIPLLPQQRFHKYTDDYLLSEYDSNILISERELSDYFDECVEQYSEPKKLANWIITEVMKFTSKTENGYCIPISSANLVNIIKLYDKKSISQSNAKLLIEKCIDTEENALDIATKSNMLSDMDDSEIDRVVQHVIISNPKACIDYKENKDKVMSFFLGQVMKATNGKANTEVAREIIAKSLEK